MRLERGRYKTSTICGSKWLGGRHHRGTRKASVALVALSRTLSRALSRSSVRVAVHQVAVELSSAVAGTARD